MKILLLGNRGQIGWELQRALAPLGEIVAPGRNDGSGTSVDFRDLPALAETVRRVDADIIVNAAGHTDVDQAEGEPESVWRLNVEAPSLLARIAAETGRCLVHYSSDYVFDGSGDTARSEDAPTAPLNVYGRSKLEAEQAIRASGCRHLVLRTSWVYAARRENFARTMLRLAQEKDRLTIIDDQFGAPTGADLIADVTAHAIRTFDSTPNVGGTYHLVASGQTNWHDYARRIVSVARLAGLPIRVEDENIVAVPSSAYPSRAERPKNSRLDTSRLRTAFQLTLPDWKSGVDRMLDEILN